MALDPSYTPDPEDETKPSDTGVAMGYSFKEIRFLKAYLKDKFTNIFQPHVDDTANPHAVTKAQVGLTDTPDWAGSDDETLGAPTPATDVLVSQRAISVAIENTVKNLIFPVGSIYSTFADITDPVDVLGFGSWVRLNAGKSIVAHDPLDPAALGTEIGANAINLTESQIPSHSHPITDPGHNHISYFSDRQMDIGSKDTDVLEDSQGSNFSVTSSTNTTGISVNANPSHVASSIDIRNEAYVVNMWKRVA